MNTYRASHHCSSGDAASIRAQGITVSGNRHRSTTRHPRRCGRPPLPWLWLWLGCGCLALDLLGAGAIAPSKPSAESLRLGVYCTAGDVLKHLADPAGRARVRRVLEPMGVTRLFLEGRRGDEYVPPALLREIREDFAHHGIESTGGIATVPGARWGVRQDSALGWLNWEHTKTRADMVEFCRENAPVFDELIVDDFYCTADTNAASQQARGARSWGEYRRDLMTTSVRPLLRDPTRQASPKTRLILKFPQWYDRFHLFGYDPARLIPQFDRIWVGTEVRDPQTRRMGYVQPVEGYMNFRWLHAQAPRQVQGAWFDHIECSAQHFLDQAYQSVLAGARELTLFRLGDVMDGHPGDALLASHWSELSALATRVAGRRRAGIAFYKPVNGEADENLYLADYLGMLGLPLLPEARFPAWAEVVILPVQAAGDAGVMSKLRRHLARGATVLTTPAFVRSAGVAAAQLAGVEPGAAPQPALATQLGLAGNTPVRLERPVDLDAGLRLTTGTLRMEAMVEGRALPWLTMRQVGRGRLWVLNVRTFAEADFRATGEWLLAPRELGLPALPQNLADALRAELMAPLPFTFEAPAGIALYLFEDAWCAYNFGSVAATARLGAQRTEVEVPAHGLVWRTLGTNRAAAAAPMRASAALSHFAP